jgi:peptidoglycan/LPS O-acetylase OafA/YrhL
VFSNLIFLNFIQPTLPSTFVSNPIQAMNGSLWTIKVEVMLYFCIPPIIYLFKKFGSIKVFALIFCLSSIWVYFFMYIFKGNIGAEISRQFPGQLAYFAFGTLLAINEKVLSKIKLISIVFLTLLFLTNNPYLKLLIDPIAYSAVVIYIATSSLKIINLGKYGDISYGIYIYHMPILNTMLSLGYMGSIWNLLFLAILTSILAFLSWKLIEQRILRLKT